jgi:hypothetical protein
MPGCLGPADPLSVSCLEQVQLTDNREVLQGAGIDNDIADE